MPTTHEIAAEINRRWTELSRDGALNREETIEQIIRTSLDSSARCIYCNSAFNLTTEEGKGAIVNHVMSCDKNPMVEVYLEAKKFLDSNLRTEHNDTDKSDAEVIAEISDITLDIKPDIESDSAGTITERVKAAIAMAKQLETAKRIMNAQELRLRELGDDSSEAVAVIGEPVHPAIRERDSAYSKHNAITAMLARFLIAHRDTHRCWLDSFVEVGAVTIDWNANPYGEVKPVKL